MLEYAEKGRLYMTAVIFMRQIVPVKSAGSKRQFERNWQFAKLYVQEAAFARPFYASGCVIGGVCTHPAGMLAGQNPNLKVRSGAFSLRCVMATDG